MHRLDFVKTEPGIRFPICQDNQQWFTLRLFSLGGYEHFEGHEDTVIHRRPPASTHVLHRSRKQRPLIQREFAHWE